MNDQQADIRDRFFAGLRKAPAIMGILNVTPDSFSDGGLYSDTDAALKQAKAMVEEGCDIVDIGGESTRPGAVAVSEAEELARIAPIVSAVCKRIDVAVSIDTYKAAVAREAVARGAVVINDVWGLQKDPHMAGTVAETLAGVIIMHNRHSVDASLDIFDDMRRFFDISLSLAQHAGISPDRIILDPGIGFGKSHRQNLDCIAGLDRLKSYGLPVLLGLSRKSVIGKVLGNEVADRLAGTLTANILGLIGGAAVIRVHDVAAHRHALTMLQATQVIDG